MRNLARNSFFQFKQFRIEQDRCAMKVCTDACTFGAWAELSDAKRILDIGTGTGLLALMAAQRNPVATIDAVEIEADAAQQAEGNFQASPFSNRIHLFQTAIQDFEPTERYDTILVNPPFYQNDLRSSEPKTNQAQHALSLTFDELLFAVTRLLKKDGTWHILLPLEEGKRLDFNAAGQGWIKQLELTLYHSSKHLPFRLMQSFSKNRERIEGLISDSLAVYEAESASHTLAFRQLLRDFYLKF